MDTSSIKRQGILFLILLLISLAFAYLIGSSGLKTGTIIVTAVLALPLLLLFIYKVEIGYFATMIVSFYIAVMARATHGLIPAALLELMMILTLSGYIIKQLNPQHSDKELYKRFNNPITYALIAWTFYIHLQAFNPHALSLKGWATIMRFTWYNLFGYFLSVILFSRMINIKLFLKIGFFLCLTVSLYGLSMEFIGFLPFESRYLWDNPYHVQNWLIFGKIRIWSTLPGPTSFGMLMTVGAIISFIMILGPFRYRYRALFFIGGMTMLYGMVVSYTRTTIIMLIIGFFFYGILTINERKTQAFIAGSAAIFLILYFGPFYSGPMTRIRSAFKGNDDPSYNVRTVNRAFIQPYIYKHPIGGGLCTTDVTGLKFYPNHPLAGFPPDGGFLQTILEVGYIGVIVLMVLYYTFMHVGISNFFRARDNLHRITYAAILSAFFSLLLANYTQYAFTIRPIDFLVFAFYGIIINLDYLRKENESEEPNELNA